MRKRHDLRRYLYTCSEKAVGHSGFTLAETLIAILILLMVSSVVAAGIPAASNAYYKVVDGANAQVLLSTAATALRDELATARDLEVGNGSSGTSTSITYYNRDAGRKSMISLDSSGILLTEYLGSTAAEAGSATGSTGTSGSSDSSGGSGSDTSEPTNVRQLVSGKARTARLNLTYTGISYDKATHLVTVSGLQVSRTGGSGPLVTQDVLIRVIAP